MSIYTHISSSTMICAFALLITACGGGNGKSANTTIRVLPEKPIVLLGSVEDQTGQTLKGPWFEFALEINNNTDETITVKAIVAEVTAQDETGTFVTSTSTWAASGYSKTIDVAGLSISCEYTSFGEIDPFTPEPLSLTNGISACQTTPRFIVGENESGPDGRNFRYRVKIKPLGWFGGEASPSDRYEKSTFFFTR